MPNELYFPDVFPVLETERLTLRLLQPEDAPTLFRLRSDKDVMRYIDRDPMGSVEEALPYIEKMHTLFAEKGGINWTLCFRETGEYIGNAGVFNLRNEHYRAMYGYVMLPEWWGKGLMTEATRKIISYTFDTMNYHSMDATINPENHASARVLEKTGFRLEGKQKENHYYRGKFLDTWLYGLIRGEEK